MTVHIDLDWLAQLSGASRYVAPAHTLDVPLLDHPLPIGPLDDRGTRPLFSVDHEETAWFYLRGRYVSGSYEARMTASDAILRPGRLSAEETFWFVGSKEAFFGYEKRAVAHRGQLVRLWPQSAHPPQGLFTISPGRGALTGEIGDLEPARTNTLAGALSGAILESEAGSTTVILAAKVDRVDLWF